MENPITEVKQSKWTPEYHRKYHLEYYHKHKNVQREYNKFTDDPKIKENYFQNYYLMVGQQMVKCEVCNIELKRCRMYYHINHSKVHKTALKVRDNIRGELDKLRVSI